MNLAERICSDWNHARMERDMTKFNFNDYVVASMVMLPEGVDDMVLRIGRIVQVRLKMGVYGSNSVFIRHSDGKLICHENQSFYRLMSKKWKHELDELFKDVSLDSEDSEYSLRGDFPATGFIVGSFEDIFENVNIPEPEKVQPSSEEFIGGIDGIPF